MKGVLKFTMWLSGFVAVVSGLSAIGSGYFRSEGVVAFRPDVYRIGTPLRLGEERALTVRIRNGTQRNVTLIGGAKLCDPMGCATVRGLPLAIPAGSERDLEVLYKPSAVGPVSYEGPVYTDHPGQPSIALKLAGMVLDKDRG